MGKGAWEMGRGKEFAAETPTHTPAHSHPHHRIHTTPLQPHTFTPPNFLKSPPPHPLVRGRVRNQNSLILLQRSRFDEASARDVTHEVAAILGGHSMLAPGDLVVAAVNCRAGSGSAHSRPPASGHPDRAPVPSRPAPDVNRHARALRA